MQPQCYDQITVRPHVGRYAETILTFSSKLIDMVQSIKKSLLVIGDKVLDYLILGIAGLLVVVALAVKHTLGRLLWYGRDDVK